MHKGRIAIITFALTTLVSASSLSYIMYDYFGVYVAVRDFDIKVESCNITAFNETYALIETLLVISNPSRYTFEVKFIMQKIFFNEGLVAVRTLSMHANPMQMGSLSNINITLQADLDSYGLSKLPRDSVENLDMSIQVGVEVPLVGYSMFRLQERVTPTGSTS